jgi:hypothetical protein
MTVKRRDVELDTMMKRVRRILSSQDAEVYNTRFGQGGERWHRVQRKCVVKIDLCLWVWCDDEVDGKEAVSLTNAFKTSEIQRHIPDNFLENMCSFERECQEMGDDEETVREMKELGDSQSDQ